MRVGQAAATKLGHHLGLRTPKTVAKQLIEHGFGLAVQMACITRRRHAGSNQLLIDQAFQTFLLKRKAGIGRFIIEKFSNLQISFNVAHLDGVLPYHGDNLVNGGGAVKQRRHYKRKQETFHQNVCPMEKKN